MCTLANIEDQDEMLHNAAFHQGLHCLLRQKQSSKRNTILGGNYSHPSIYTVDHPKFIALNQKDESISA